jgi:glycosyltransferase involved in cell wall biosynthesis
MAVRNMEQWLPATLDSLRIQTRTDFEVIAVDDGSTDGTTEILRTAVDLPLTVIRAPGVGLGAARNLAIEASTAPLLSVLDGDDLWLENYVEQVVSRLEQDNEIAIVSPELLLAIGEEVTTSRYYADGHPLQWYDHDQLEHLVDMNYIVPLSTYRRDILDAVGGYDPTPGAIEDWDLWIRALQAGFRAGHITEPCGVYRFRPGSLTTDRISLLKGRIAVLEPLAGSGGVVGQRARAALAFQRFQLTIAEGKDALVQGNYAVARSKFSQVARDPSATLRQRAGAVVTASFPRAGRAALDRRASREQPALVAQIRSARE